jgi:hypothetical protein
MFAGLMVVTACSPEQLMPGQYIRWVEDPENELVASRELDGFSFELQYKPVPYIILMENSGKYPGATQFWKRAAQLNGMQYYTLRISSDQDKDLLKAGIRNDNEYYSRLEYFTSIMQNDISLVSGTDTLACVLFHYERNYNLSPRSNFLLGFENPSGVSTSGERILVFQDQVFGTGIIKLTIPEQSITDLPALTEAL